MKNNNDGDLSEDKDLFLSTYAGLFERMINTAPQGVILTASLHPIPVKPDFPNVARDTATRITNLYRRDPRQLKGTNFAFTSRQTMSRMLFYLCLQPMFARPLFSSPTALILRVILSLPSSLSIRVSRGSLLTI